MQIFLSMAVMWCYLGAVQNYRNNGLYNIPSWDNKNLSIFFFETSISASKPWICTGINYLVSPIAAVQEVHLSMPKKKSASDAKQTWLCNQPSYNKVEPQSEPGTSKIPGPYSYGNNPCRTFCPSTFISINNQTISPSFTSEPFNISPIIFKISAITLNYPTRHLNNGLHLHTTPIPKLMLL